MKITIVKYYKSVFIIPTVWYSYEDVKTLSFTWLGYSLDIDFYEKK